MINIKSNQQGVALLLAILIVALVSIVSIEMLTQRQLQIYRTANLYFRDQGYQISLGVEAWAKSILQQDFENDKKNSISVDSELDVWSTASFDYTIELAEINGNIFDLQGRLNLNNLVKEGKVQDKWLTVYQRLLNLLDLSPSLAVTLVDWMDSNEQPTGTSGAEDVYYIALEPPYRTANQNLSHLSELLLIKGYDQKIYQILKNYVYIAPDEEKVNINTSSKELIQALIPGLTVSEADSVLGMIEINPYLKIEDFTSHPQIMDKAVDAGLLMISSNYFSVNSQVDIDKTKINLQSIINRDKLGNIRVVSRQESFVYKKTTLSQENDKPE